MFIYIIKNKINDKRYIGLTEKQTPEGRFKEHVYMRGAKCHNGWAFTNALNKYGPENFYLEWFGDYSSQIQTIEELGNLEKQFIAYYRTYVGFEDCRGYNMTLGGEYATVTNCKKVIQYDKKSNQLQTFNSIQDASRITGASSVEIIKCCQRKTKSAGGYMWSYDGDIPPSPFENKQSIIIQQYDLQMNLIAEYSSMREASNKVGISDSMISLVCNGHRKQSKGFIWKFKGNSKLLSNKTGKKKKVAQLDLQTGKIINTFKSAHEAGKYLGIQAQNITKCCRGGSKSSFGYNWEYI